MSKLTQHHVPCPACGKPAIVEVHSGYRETRFSPAEPKSIYSITPTCACPEGEALTETQAWTWLETHA